MISANQRFHSFHESALTWMITFFDQHFNFLIKPIIFAKVFLCKAIGALVFLKAFRQSFDKHLNNVVIATPENVQKLFMAVKHGQRMGVKHIRKPSPDNQLIIAFT